MTPSRRELLQLLGASSALLAVGCTGTGTGSEAAPLATAVLDPDEDSFVVAVWSRLAAREITVEVRAGDQSVAELHALLDGELGTIEVTDLTPGTTYSVAIKLGGLVLQHIVRTAPALDDPRPVRLAISAD